VVFFVRHAEAVDRDGFDGPDLARPLTPRGRRRFRAAVAALSKRVALPTTIVSSGAVRARETADVLVSVTGAKKAAVDESLNPGADVSAIRNAIAKHGSGGTVALVGHEPDFSEAIAALCGAPGPLIDLKKGAVACVRLTGRTGLLAWLVTPRLLARD